MISACNQLPATVSEMKKGRVTTNVRLATASSRVTAVIATSSAEEMALAVGDQVTVLFREVDVLLMKGDGAERVSASNRIPGTVLGITKGNVTAEIPLEVGVGRITAVIARTSAEEMGLAVGDRVTAMFREVDVILAKGADLARLSARKPLRGRRPGGQARHRHDRASHRAR